MIMREIEVLLLQGMGRFRMELKWEFLAYWASFKCRMRHAIGSYWPNCKWFCQLRGWTGLMVPKKNSPWRIHLEFLRSWWLQEYRILFLISFLEANSLVSVCVIPMFCLGTWWDVMCASCIKGEGGTGEWFFTIITKWTHLSECISRVRSIQQLSMLLGDQA
jgi:hypothetical protein